MRRARLKQLFALIISFCVFSVFIWMAYMPLGVFWDGTSDRERDGTDWRELVFTSNWKLSHIVDSSRCQIVFEDPLPPEWITRLFGQQWLHCEHPHNKRPLFDVDITAYRSCPILRMDILRIDYKLTAKQIQCVYFDMAKSRRDTSQGILSEVAFGKGARLKSGDCPHVEEMWIVCQVGNSSIEYRQPLMLPQLRRVPKVVGATNSFHVMVLEVDSVSRLAFQRTMPNTQRKLEALFGDRLIQLYGYSKIGDSPATRQIPLFTGSPLFPDDAKDAPFDNWTRFVWEDFKDHGYSTMFLEETPSRSLFEYPDYRGFVNPPTDYFPSRFLSTIEHAYGNRTCVFNGPMAKILLDHVHNTMRLLTRNRPLFSYVRLNRLTERNLSGGLLLDDTLAHFFNELEASGTLAYTVVFFVSDHGCSTSKFSLSPQGRLEETLPFAFILPPTEFIQHRAESLTTMAINSQRLTTPLDVFETLVDIATGGVAPKENQTGPGVSLLSTEVPLERTCDDAGIFGAYCSCYNGRTISSPILGGWFRRLLIERINQMLDEDAESGCARFTDADTIHFEQLYEGRMPLNKFRIRVRMTPPAEFEGLFEKQGKHAELEFVERLDDDDDDFNRGCHNVSRNEQLCYCAE